MRLANSMANKKVSLGQVSEFSERHPLKESLVPSQASFSEQKSVLVDNNKQYLKGEYFNASDYVIPGITARDVEIYKQIFDTLDVNDKGVLYPKDLKVLIQLGNDKINKQVVYQLISDFDSDENGEIEFSEFVTMMSKRPCDEDSSEDIRRVFNQIDKNGNGYISIEDIINLSNDLGEKIKEEEVKEIIRKCDPDNKGKKISWPAFLKFNQHINFNKIQ